MASTRNPTPCDSRSQCSTCYSTRTATSTARKRKSSSSSWSRPGTTTTRANTARSKTTTKTATATSTDTSRDQQVICAITESRGMSPTIGLAFANLSTTEAVLCQIVDNQTYTKTLHKLCVFEPTEIVIPHSFIGPTKSKLLQALEAHLDFSPSIIPIARKYWDEAAGVEYIQNLAFREDVDALKVAVGGSFFATSCLSAALGYAENALEYFFVPHTMRMRYEPPQGSMLIDISTIKSLELIQNLQNARSKDCLFGLLNQTLTPMGARLLRSSILQPLTEPTELKKRYEALEELTSQEGLFFKARNALKQFLDADRVLTAIVVIPSKPSVQYWEQSTNNVLLVKHYLRAVPAVYEALQGVKSELLVGIHRRCAPGIISGVSTSIDEVINEDITYQKKPLDLRNQRIYAVKAGFHSLLDVARQTYREANQDAVKLREELSNEYKLRLEMKFDTGRSYYFTLPASELENECLPEVFVNAYRGKKNTIECQTLGLIKLNQMITDSNDEVLCTSQKVVEDLTDSIRDNVAPLFKISESIALLDMLTSLGQVATSQDYCRPELTSTLAIKNGRHPIRERIQTEKYIPNDVYATERSRVQIITGCNMSGKSTYIRSVALMAIMAQIGSFIPAEYASFPIRHQLFTRVALDDSSTSNVSTFAAEMQETAFILHNVNASSLVIIDELGRGTSTRDGLAIAVAVAEALVQSGALVWFVTHFQELPAILQERPGVVNLHLAVGAQNDDYMTMTYKIAQGSVKEKRYGLTLAKVAGLPPDVIDVAEAVSQKLTELWSQERGTSLDVFQARRKKVMLTLKEQLSQAKESNMRGDVLRELLQRLQTEFVIRMSKLEQEERVASAETARTMSTTESQLSDVAGNDHDSVDRIESVNPPGHEEDPSSTGSTSICSESMASSPPIPAHNNPILISSGSSSSSMQDRSSFTSCCSMTSRSSDTLVRSPSPTPDRLARDGMYVMSGALQEAS